MSPAFTLRTAGPADGASIAELVRELAEYEREPDAATATADDFARALAPGTGIGCVLAEVETDHGVEVAGMALWYTTFSTWLGRQGMWLEDLFVRPQHRRAGIGRAFFAELGRVCAERGFGRLEFWVLDWNTSAHDFYRALGARPEEDWTVWRVDGRGLDALGSPPDRM
ncbi:GNAT superfamily N-acetyltransferase [Kineococcus radiotolerans]|uniref:GCN5-related N-acetyltransferase n=2 Tax=Kineococcus radiotolerans TaxID=131568 RepID=A6WEL5_KINRD|nr:GNAT family N-acetyltransferase [Kineococcus radiotolerans]ABS05254.1 GCN5-related N-acetyltransferase [Kineococcus radiotolerans SRS30216 = ATCC BAA-149]MBB2902126.1 GNAT superfamily N-acetyltransferase [Kineococcus radiotolerans]